MDHTADRAGTGRPQRLTGFALGRAGATATPAPGARAGRFSWTSFDVRSLLAPGWRERIVGVAREHRAGKLLRPPHSTSREHAGVRELPVLTVPGRVVQRQLPEVVELYRTTFRDLVQEAVAEPLVAARDERYAVVLNVQEGDGSRYECHVDTNPVEALLYVTSHPPGTGGELVVANRPGAASVEEVDADCTVLYPQEGHLVCFDGRHHPHYVRALAGSGLRVAVAMNYYVPSCPEETRPPDLDEYLYGSR